MNTGERQPIISEFSRKRKLAMFVKHLPPSASVLEVGAGDGWFSGKLRESGFSVTTIDLLGPADIVGDIRNWKQLGISEESYDAVVALEVIEHVDCWTSLKAVCKRNGLIMLSSPHPDWDWFMKVLECVRLTQKRTSDHTNLTDFKTLDLPPVLLERPAFIHQVGIFRNEK